MRADPLIESIDKAASDLLQRVSSDGEVPLPERVKAFEAITKWAEMKTRLAPASKGDSKFGNLRARLNGGKASGRGVRPEGEEGSPVADTGG